ncbi:hypothetical protein ACFFRR_001140 [Megaselia abdita]
MINKLGLIISGNFSKIAARKDCNAEPLYKTYDYFNAERIRAWNKIQEIDYSLRQAEVPDEYKPKFEETKKNNLEFISLLNSWKIVDGEVLKIIDQPFIPIISIETNPSDSSVSSNSISEHNQTNPNTTHNPALPIPPRSFPSVNTLQSPSFPSSVQGGEHNYMLQLINLLSENQRQFYNLAESQNINRGLEPTKLNHEVFDGNVKNFKLFKQSFER